MLFFAILGLGDLIFRGGGVHLDALEPFNRVFNLLFICGIQSLSYKLRIFWQKISKKNIFYKLSLEELSLVAPT